MYKQINCIILILPTALLYYKIKTVGRALFSFYKSYQKILFNIFAFELTMSVLRIRIVIN